MNKIILAFLIITLIFAFASCNNLGDDSDILYGTVDINPIPNSENITHQDYEVNDFLRDKVTFLNKVYPGMPTPEGETNGQYRQVTVYVEPRNLIFDRLENADWQRALSENAETVLEEYYPALGITRGEVRGALIVTTYQSYDSFAETDLPKLAKDPDDKIAHVYIKSTKGYNKGENLFLNKHSFISESNTLASLSEDQREYLLSIISSSQPAESEGELPEAVPYVGSTYYQSEVMEELFKDSICPSYCMIDGFCDDYVSGPAIIVNESDIDQNSIGRYSYIILMLEKASSGYTLTLNGLDLKNGRLTVSLTYTELNMDAEYPGVSAVIKIDNTLLDSEITDVETILFSTVKYPF